MKVKFQVLTAASMNSRRYESSELIFSIFLTKLSPTEELKILYDHHFICIYAWLLYESWVTEYVEDVTLQQKIINMK
jgi:hypothetical protein